MIGGIRNLEYVDILYTQRMKKINYNTKEVVQIKRKRNKKKVTELQKPEEEADKKKGDEMGGRSSLHGILRFLSVLQGHSTALGRERERVRLSIRKKEKKIE
jgi:hypothetical protein